MISSKSDYLFYLEADRIALGKSKRGIKKRIIELIAPDYIWQFQRLLRKFEYYKNCKTGFFNSIFLLFIRLKFRKLSLKLGFTISENSFGPGLAIIHYGTIVVNDMAKIGANCRIHASTNIGASNGSNKAPQIGDNVYIGPGSIIFGDISIPNNTLISANSTVNKTFTEENTMLAGSPAKVIKTIDVKTVIKHLN
jgi:serine O-acetyltransferase